MKPRIRGDYTAPKLTSFQNLGFMKLDFRVTIKTSSMACFVLKLNLQPPHILYPLQGDTINKHSQLIIQNFRLACRFTL